MKNSAGPRWYNAAIVVGVIYFAITVTTGALAAMAQTGRGLFLWRLSAFVFSGLVFLAHIAYEHFQIHSAPKMDSKLVSSLNSNILGGRHNGFRMLSPLFAGDCQSAGRNEEDRKQAEPSDIPGGDDVADTPSPVNRTLGPFAPVLYI